MDAAERELLQATIGDALAAVDADQPDAVDAVLADLGWIEMLDTARADAVPIVFRALGTTNAMGSALDDVIVAAFGLEPRADLAVVLPPFATWDPPGSGADGSARGLATSRVNSARQLLVVSGDGADLRGAAVPIAAADIQVVRGVDPDAGLHTVQLDLAIAGSEPLPVGADWEAAVAWGRVAVSHQIAGACRTMLELARTHALERVQFGRPIAHFQAVRHRLATALVAVEALDASLAAAVDDPGPMTAALAKACAGRTAGTVAEHCQQILAGIGFTTDHPFHRFLKRTMVLDGLLGSGTEITVALGRQLLTTRRVPTLIDL